MEDVGGNASPTEENGARADGSNQLDGADDADLFGSDSENEGRK